MFSLKKCLFIILSFFVLFVLSIAQDAHSRTVSAVTRPVQSEPLPPDSVATLLSEKRIPYQDVADRLAIARPLRIYGKDAHPVVAGHWETTIEANQVNVSVLLLTDENRNDWQDLVFIRMPEGAWAFAGVWNMPGLKGKRPIHGVVTTGPGRSMLAVRYKGIPNIDCTDVEEESWLELGSAGLHETVRFPAAASGCSQTLVPGFNSGYRVTDYRQWSIEKSQRFELRYSVEHTALSPTTMSAMALPPLFSQTVFVRYMWIPTTQTFIMDQENSDTIEETSRYHLVLDPNKLVRYHTNDLLKLARSGSERQQSWLSGLLNVTREGPAKAKIARELDNRPNRVSIAGEKDTGD